MIVPSLEQKRKTNDYCNEESVAEGSITLEEIPLL